MESDAVVGWLLVGPLIGGLALVSGPGRRWGGVLGILAAAGLGALLGVWGWVLLLGRGPAMFLGCAIVGVVSTLALQYVLRSVDHRRYGV